MFSVLAKSGAQLALAAMVSATGFGLAATHSSDVSADNSTQIEVPQPNARQLSGDAQSTVAGHAGSDVRTPATPAAGHVAANAGATASGAVQSSVDSAPPAPAATPTTEPAPAPQPSGNLSVDASAHVAGSGQISLGGGGVSVGSDSNGSAGLQVSPGF